jgi:hypothetical protein
MTTTLAAPPSTIVQDLVLVRMALSGPSAKKIRADLGSLMQSELSDSELDELRSELTAAGFLTKGKRNTFALTDAGRERALRFLGVAELPPRTSWTALVARYLFPMAAGLSASAAAELNTGDRLAAFLLKRKYGLTSGAGSTVSQVLEAVACKELGFEDETTLDGLLRAVLSQLMGSERLTREELAKQLPLFQTGLTSITSDATRCQVVRDWLGGAPAARHVPAPPLPEPFDLPAFARTVRALAASSPPEDRFHGNKVFIGPLWRMSQREPNFPRLSLPEFKQRLVESNTQNLLHLSRADLVEAMDHNMVADSEISHPNATFHFVLLEENST